ncbi:hypothetical protein KY289_036649 [Solanum tuberosum]|nr:hypothetical protein KY284_036475 [Solanum tuberosum]KAH0636734.1 hypothetical protein KY289_036649 [Solanum tuberosum]
MRIRYGAGGVISTHSIDGCDWKLLNELEGLRCCQLGRGCYKEALIALLRKSSPIPGFVANYSSPIPFIKKKNSSPIRVTVADGNYMLCTSICTSFSWKMEGKPFREDLRIIKLGGCDIVLGKDWMKKYNPTKFDHEKRSVTIGKKANKVVLHAIPEGGSFHIISSGTINGKTDQEGSDFDGSLVHSEHGHNY